MYGSITLSLKRVTDQNLGPDATTVVMIKLLIQNKMGLAYCGYMWKRSVKSVHLAIGQNR